MDHNFTEKIRTWLEAPEADRDYSVAALYILKLSGNQILYKNLVADLNRHRQHIEHQLQKYYDFRVQSLTHAQVKEMEAQVEVIAAKHLDPEKTESHRTGRRDDHDLLPDEIKALYVENLSILQRMRELHLKLRSLSVDNAVCPDSERFPFLKELIALDKKMHTNWKEYDRYVPTRKRSVRKSSAATR